MSRNGRKRKLEAEEKAIYDWEKKRFLSEKLRNEMETMWEIPQVYHFLQLTKDALNITHLSMYEVERMLMMPQASKQLAHIMTCLLSPPSIIRSKLHKLPPMPYEFWTNILMHKLKGWFKIYHVKRQDSVKVFDTLGVEPEFWEHFPDDTKTVGKDFQDFTFKQRVWLLKTVCDTVMYTRKTLQDEMSKQPSENQFETILGFDRYGARYIYFPQFLHNDLRVYKLSLDNKIFSTLTLPDKDIKIEEEITIKEESKPAPRFITKRKRRKSRWSNGTCVPPKKRDKKKSDLSSSDQSINDSNSIDMHGRSRSRSSSKTSDASSLIKFKSDDANTSGEIIDDSTTPTKCEDSKKIKDEVMVANNLNKSLRKRLRSENFLVKENSLSTIDDLSKSSKTDDEKLEEISSINASKNNEKSGNACKQLVSDLGKDRNISKSDDEKLSENKKCDTPTDNEYLNDEMSLDKWMEARRRNIDDSLTNSDNEDCDSTLNRSRSRRLNRSNRCKNVSEIKSEIEEPEDFEDVDKTEDSENLLDLCETEELSSIRFRDRLCRASTPEVDDNCLNEHFKEDEWKVENLEETMKDISISNFQLVAYSLESLNELIDFISSDKTIPDFKTKENFIRPPCEEILLKRMKILSESLHNFENILKESTKKARNKLQREWYIFEHGVADEDEEAEDGSNRWLIGSQGWPFYGVGADRPPALPNSTVSPIGCRESVPEENASADTATAAEPTLPGGQNQPENNPENNPEKHSGNQSGCEKSENHKNGEEVDEPDEVCSKQEKGAKANKEEGREENKGNENQKENEPEPCTRVLRARGVSSYTEQLFFDDESEEEKLDRWAHIEALYATPSAQIHTSTPDTPTKSRDSGNDSEKEDSDQDWILPSSRKRKNKRPSASRRLKSFQYKLQNIKVDSNGKVSDNKYQQPSHTKDTKALPPQTIQKVPGNVKSSTKSPAKSFNKTAFSKVRTNSVTSVAVSSISATCSVPSNPVKIEGQETNLHSVLDIKDEGPVYDPASANRNVNCVQPNYVVVTTGHAPVANYYVMQQNPPTTTVMQQNQFIQPTAFVSQMVPQSQVQAIQQVQSVPAPGYYVQPNTAQNYIVQNPSGLITATSPRQTFLASGTPQVVYQSQQQQIVQTPSSYVQYVTTPQQQLPQEQQTLVTQPRIINTTTLTPPRQISYRMRGPGGPQNNNRMPLPARQQNFPHPNGAVIRSAPLSPNVLRPGQRVSQPRSIAPRRQIVPRLSNLNNKSAQPTSTTGQKSSKTTSLIVLSDSDDEIEMIITEKNEKNRTSNTCKEDPSEQSQKIKNALPPELMQRMSEGGISISPIKPVQPTFSQNTQLVVVVNETGSHYALALPNGSKLILTPEQVAQIRASNGGKLVL